MLVCTPLIGQAATLGQGEDPDQLWDISRELFQECLKQRNSLQVKNHRGTLPLDGMRIHAKLQQGDLLQELLTSDIIRHESTWMMDVGEKSQQNSHENSRLENLLLKEFTAEPSIP